MPRKKGTIYNDLSGQRLGKLVVIERDFSKDYPRPYFLCKCDCGEETVICSSSLTRKKKPTRSCGCGAREARTLSEGIANARAVFTSYKASAKNREIPFNISKKDFLELTSQDCFYCGGEPSMIRSEKRSNGPYVYNGVDRVDNERGYSLENCVPCCKFCNRMKRDLGKKEFLEHIKNIYNEQVIWEEE